MTAIIVTNDDGYTAPGILALAQAMQTLGDVRVSAPGINQSASGHKKTLHQDMDYKRTTIGDGIPTLAVYGSPADCIAVTALGLAGWAPDIVVSGINRGENMGQDLTYSGTVTAALEASIHGVPAVAVSLSNPTADDVADYQIAAQITIPIVKKILFHGLPPFTILNVNVPNVSSIDDIKGVLLTRQGVRVYLDEIKRTNDIVRIQGPPPVGNFDEIGTDLWAVHRNYVSVTPVHLDMTAHQLMANLEAWDIQLPNT
jgi:5'-nucleotidase